MNNKEKAMEAARHLNSTWDGKKCYYFDDGTLKTYVCDREEEMVQLYDMIHCADTHDADEDLRDLARDAYSHWCSGTTHPVEDEEVDPSYVTEETPSAIPGQIHTRTVLRTTGITKSS